MPALLVGVLLGFAAGFVALQASATLPSWPRVLLAAALAIATYALGRPRVRSLPPFWHLLLASALAALVGFAYAGWRADARMADALPESIEGRDIILVGVVDGLPASSARGLRFAFAVESVVPPDLQVPRRVSLAWFGEWPGREAATAPLPAVHAGERWQLTVRLKRPHGNANPGGFDLEAWLLQQNLRATGVVREATTNHRIDDFAGRLRDHLQRSRERIRTRIFNALEDAPYAGIVVALAIGDQRAISDTQWTVLNRTGIGHLVSISGLHVTVFATMVGSLVHALARRCTWLTSRRPARHPAAAVGLVAAAGYVAIAGAEIPALRTLAMLAVAAMGIACGRQGSAGLVWLWALVAVLVWDPWAPLAPGFWLSFGAVGLLLYAADGRLSAPAGSRSARVIAALREATHAQWVVTLGLTPFTLLLFGQMSLIAPLANAVAIPVVTLAVVPLALVGIFVPFESPFVGAHAVLSPLMRLMEAAASAPDAAWQQHTPPPWAAAAGVVGVVLLLAPRGLPGRAWGWLWLLPLFLARPPPLPEGAFRLTVLDVGQGLAAVVETRQYALVYDTGPRFTDAADAGNRIVAPFLRVAGVRRVTGLMLSHGDLDHAGGARSLLEAVPVDWFASSLFVGHDLLLRLAGRTPVMSCMAGQQWTWDGVHFAVLHPTALEYADARTRSNDRSCVLRIEGPGGSVLLTGDIEAISELRLLARDASALRSDVLVVPHHGSRTSSTPAFVRAVAPSVAIVSSGYRNRFGHPRPDIEGRYRAAGAQLLRTDLDGAVILTMTPNVALRLSTGRQSGRRYWHDHRDPVASVPH